MLCFLIRIQEWTHTNDTDSEPSHEQGGPDEAWRLACVRTCPRTGPQVTTLDDETECSLKTWHSEWAISGPRQANGNYRRHNHNNMSCDMSWGPRFCYLISLISDALFLQGLPFSTNTLWEYNTLWKHAAFHNSSYTQVISLAAEADIVDIVDKKTKQLPSQCCKLWCICAQTSNWAQAAALHAAAVFPLASAEPAASLQGDESIPAAWAQSAEQAEASWADCTARAQKAAGQTSNICPSEPEAGWGIHCTGRAALLSAPDWWKTWKIIVTSYGN